MISMISEVVCHMTHDGKIFDNEGNAKAHAHDLLGEQLTALIGLAGLNITHSEEFGGVLKMIENGVELKRLITIIHSLIEYGDE